MAIRVQVYKAFFPSPSFEIHFNPMFSKITSKTGGVNTSTPGWSKQPPHNHQAGSLRLITGGQQSAGAHPSGTAALLQNNLAYTGSTPLCLGGRNPQGSTEGKTWNHV